MTSTKLNETPNINDVLAALNARALNIPAEVEELRTQRGPLALQAAMDRTKAAALDDLDQSIASLEREADDVQAAIAEATLQVGEQKMRGKIEKARAAMKKLPAAEKRLRTAYEGLRLALDGVTAALAAARAAERDINAVVADAVPFESDCGDVYAVGQRTFSASRSIDPLLTQAASTDQHGFRTTIAESLTDHIDRRIARIAPLSDERVQRMEHEMQQKRTGLKRREGSRTIDPAAIPQIWPTSKPMAGGQSFVDVYGNKPA